MSTTVEQKRVEQMAVDQEAMDLEAAATTGSVEIRKLPAKRDDGVSLLAAYHFVLSGFFLLATIGLAIPAGITGIVGIFEDSDALIATFILVLIGLVMMIFCVMMLVLGYGLWKQKQWARVASMALAVLSLLLIPIGTVTGGITLWHLMKPEIAETFS